MRFYRPFSEGPFWSDRRRLNTGVINQINYGPVPTRWARAQTNGWGALNGAIVLSITSVFTPLTSHSGLCEKSRSLKNIHACSMLTKNVAWKWEAGCWKKAFWQGKHEAGSCMRKVKETRTLADVKTPKTNIDWNILPQ